MSYFYGLSGRPNIGKSTTIGILYAMLIASGAQIVKKRFSLKSKDFVTIVQFKEKLVGICSYRDARSIIIEKLSLFREFGCFLSVCACREDGPTREAVASFKGEKRFFRKQIAGSEEERSVLNKRDAQILFDAIQIAVVSTERQLTISI